MIIRSLVILYFLLPVEHFANGESREKYELTISECAAKGGECDESRGRPVCGTDDRTYPTRCHLLRVQCSGHQVSLKYRGPCRACKEVRDYALKHKAKNPLKFVPRCKNDGTYAPMQCLGDTGCWCSDITGKPIENTAVRTGKPKCREHSRTNIRRSPARHLGTHRVCTQIDRAAFNTNLIKVFQSEFIRSGQYQTNNALRTLSTAPGGQSVQSDKHVLDWKFSTLDTNGNQVLDKNEFRELKKLVKRAVKPRRCGRAFGKFCDVNNDDKLSRNEWNNCITKDGINRLPGVDNKNSAVNNVNDPGVLGYIHHQGSNNNYNGNNHHFIPHPSINRNNNNISNRNRNQHFINNINHRTLDDLNSESGSEDDENSQRLDYDDNSQNEDEDDEDDDDDDQTINNSFGSPTKFPITSMYNLNKILRPHEEPILNESEVESDCLADQAVALEEQRHGGTILYVPECTPDGRYQRVQCYRSTPYCWCVHEDTGKNIPGTSVKDIRPQCDSIYPQTRPMKGCPEPRKAEFLRNLKEYFKTQFLANTNIGANATKWNSEDERIATLSFVLLDKNKNKLWERKEWKTFRELVTKSKLLRKCGKKMPRYCDVNSDKKITLSEWLNCLQSQKIEVEIPKTMQTNESASIKPSKLTGSNPLEQYLKD